MQKRNAIVLEETIQRRVAELAKESKLSQGLVIETMMNLLQTPELKSRFEQALQDRRTSKVTNRTGKTALLKKLSKLSAAQLEELAKQLEGAE